MLLFNKCKVVCVTKFGYYFTKQLARNIGMHRVEDNRLFTFTRICDEIAKERSYLNKANILQDFFKKGCNKKEFQGDLLLWVRMLIPGDSQRVYNLKNKQMLKLFSRLLNTDHEEMQLDLEQGKRWSCLLSNLTYLLICVIFSLYRGRRFRNFAKIF